MRSVGLLCTSLALALLAGCAEERPPINRVQSGALSKSFFVGQLEDPADDPQFYWRNYVVDASASQSLVGVGSWGGVDRIRWEITEDMLIARKAYQIADGVDHKDPESLPDGTVVAAFPIQSHFDVRRAYNPTTGEQSNIIEENTSDRRWNEREYFRVDWSRNVVDSPQWDDIFRGKLFGEMTITPATYDITDPNHPDAPHFDVEDGYFDITTRYYVKPEMSFIPGLPTCMLIGFYTGSTTYECDDQEATVRSSFLRVDPDADFERLEMTKAPLDIVGNPAGIDSGPIVQGLLAGRVQGYDPGYGFTDELFHQYANIHNIWKESHQETACGANADTDLNGTADECESAITGYEGNTGSQCDVAASRCTIPYRDREVRTVGYWLNAEMPAELQDPEGGKPASPAEMGAAEQMIASWNQLMKGAVARSREVECRRTGGDRDVCTAAFIAPEKEMIIHGGWLVDRSLDDKDVLTLCHNPVRSYDDEICGKKGDVARLGDIRKNFLAYWPAMSRAPWGGIGNWGGDPLTGEIHGAAAMIMGDSVTYAAARQRDIIQLTLGDIKVEDITNGVPAQNYVHTLQNGHAPKAIDAAELDRRVASIDAEHALRTSSALPLAGETLAEKVSSYHQSLKKSTVDPALHRDGSLELDALSAKLRGTRYEAELVDSHWLVNAAAMSPDSSATEEVLEQVSPLRGMDPGSMKSIKGALAEMLSLKGMCFHGDQAPVFGSFEMQGLAQYYKNKYPDGEYDARSRGEAIYKDLWIEAFKGIAIHELGHSLGLLHNFSSSWDAQNYHPQYWQLRTQEGRAAGSCNGVPRTGDSISALDDHCMGPRYLDPETDDELGLAGEPRPSVTYFGQTSVMEYPGERFGETVGLGQYDAHAMKALYGRVLETFDDADRGGLSLEEQVPLASRMLAQIIPSDLVMRSSAPFKGQRFAKPTHYTEVARMMKVFDPSRCRDATPEEIAVGGFRIVHGKICAPAPKDHAAWADFESGETEKGDASSLAVSWRTGDKAITGAHKVRWMYRYGTSSNSYIHTNPSDSGADAYELVVNMTRKFDANYPWSYFRRQDREYFWDSLPSAISNSVLERARSYHWSAASTNVRFMSLGPQYFDEIAKSDDWQRPAIMGEQEAFKLVARIMLMPEPGDYGAMPQGVDQERSIFDAGEAQQLTSFTIGAGDGRFVGEDFNSDPDGGGSWNYTTWMNHAGFGVEKTYAAMALTDARPTLSTISRENYLDDRGVRMSFRADMPQAVDRLIGGILSEDWEAVAPYVGAGKTPQLEMLDLDDAAEPTRPAGAKVLFPNIGYKQQLGALVFTNLYSRFSTDMTLVNKMRVWVLGHEEAVEVPEAEQIRFFDPQSGYTYIARLYGDEVIDGKTVDRGVASRMILHANALLAATYEVEIGPDGKRLVDEFGTPVLVRDASGQPKVVSDARFGQLVRYVGLLDAARQVSRSLGNGPIGGDE